MPLDGLAIGERALAKETAVYVARVHRLGEGDAFVAFDPERALEAEALIVESTARSVTVRIEAVRPAARVAPRAVTLVQALGKGDKLDAIVRDATELGATRIVPVVAERSVVRPDEGTARVQRWRRIAIEAARQCGRGDAPRIDAPIPLIEAVRSLAAERAPLAAERAPLAAERAPLAAERAPLAAERAPLAAERSPASPWGVCLVPGAASSLGEALRALPHGAPFTVVVGPEGGLSAAEIAACEDAGLAPAGLGPLVLRTETVCAAVLGAIAILAS